MACNTQELGYPRGTPRLLQLREDRRRGESVRRRIPWGPNQGRREPVDDHPRKLRVSLEQVGAVVAGGRHPPDARAVEVM